MPYTCHWHALYDSPDPAGLRSAKLMAPRLSCPGGRTHGRGSGRLQEGLGPLSVGCIGVPDSVHTLTCTHTVTCTQSHTVIHVQSHAHTVTQSHVHGHTQSCTHTCTVTRTHTATCWVMTGEDRDSLWRSDGSQTPQGPSWCTWSQGREANP